MRKSSNIAIIGTGNAAYEHFKCLKLLNPNKIYIVTRRKKNSKIKKFKNKKTKIIEGLHNIPSDTDAFVVATPWYLNDKIVNFFKFEKKPILFEKPLGAFNSNYKFIKYKKNKYIGVNRRYFKTISYVKKLLNNENYQILDVDIRISEKYLLFKKRFKNHLSKIYFFSSIHMIDLIIFLFGSPKKIIKLRSSKSRNSFKNKHFYFKYKKFNLSLNIYDDTCENNSITLRFINGEKIVIKPLEKLQHYDKLIIKTINDKRFYIPHVKKEIIEKNSHLKPGFFVQMKLFMENKLSINIQRYINTLKLIRYLSNA